ncbi:MAG: sulfatase [Alphaproteobacteria bacterium]|nr:sulfatase [Alphaproteobacteria bacterium]|tara:strand:+ start:1825 stop:3270 length:1446 start_codon:yes stop_codon:yes gene_type:complete
MSPTNVLFITSDEHNRDISGCYGNTIVKTPALDALAERGTLFTDAYTNSPICVPARASFATGRYVHEVRFWDNAIPYDGSTPSWGHRLQDTGHSVTSIGKLHYRSSDDDNGFDEEILSLHVVDGIGNASGLIRKGMPQRETAKDFAESIGRGSSSYSDYDRNIADAACRWLAEEAPRRSDKPWALYVSFVTPHYPLIAPEEYFDLYSPDDIPMPRMYGEDKRPRHPVIDTLRYVWNYDDYFDEDRVRLAIAAYYALCSFMDACIGRVLAALDGCGLSDSTTVIYSSDHGENLGEKGLWGKSVLYECAAAVPLIIAGPEVPSGKRVASPVSLVDIYPTIIGSVGETDDPDVDPRPGTSLVSIANGDVAERTVLSEYHASGSITGEFMVRVGKWKYIHYVGFRPQLFDLEADPHEALDLASDPGHAKTLAMCEAELCKIVDPDAANDLAFEDQASRIDELGGPDAIFNRQEFGFTPAPGQPIE